MTDVLRTRPRRMKVAEQLEDVSLGELAILPIAGVLLTIGMILSWVFDHLGYGVSDETLHMLDRPPVRDRLLTGWTGAGGPGFPPDPSARWHRFASARLGAARPRFTKTVDLASPWHSRRDQCRGE